MTHSTTARFYQFVGTFLRGRHVIGRQGSARRIAKKNRCEFYEHVWREAAKHFDADVSKLTNDVMRIQRGEDSTVVSRNYTELDGPVTLQIAGSKAVSRRLLTDSHLPLPASTEFRLDNLKPAYSFLRQHTTCVVKPGSGTGAGQGVTTNIRTPRQLRYAIMLAAGYAKELTIEAQIEGENLRLLFLDGRLLDAVRRRPPAVVGDGSSTISRLIAEENQHRLQKGFKRAQTLISCDLEMRWNLAQQGLSLHSVPTSGKNIQVKNVVNDNSVDDNDDVTDVIGDSIVETCRTAAAAIRGRTVGVDVIVPNVTADMRDGVVLEVNTTPGFYYHYYRTAPTNPIAIPILEQCFALSHYKQAISTATMSTLGKP